MTGQACHRLTQPGGRLARLRPLQRDYIVGPKFGYLLKLCMTEMQSILGI